MCFWYYFFGILGIIIVLLIIFGYPRKINVRESNFEGIDDPAVAKAFERMTNFLPFKLLRCKIISQLKKLLPRAHWLILGVVLGISS